MQSRFAKLFKSYNCYRSITDGLFLDLMEEGKGDLPEIY